MKKIFKILSLLCLSWVLHSGVAQGQAIKTNVPFLLTGNPNLGLEWNVGSRFSVNVDGLWMPYLWVSKNENENVMRALVGTLDFRYYLKPRFYYTNKSYDGFYLGPYVMFGNYNMGIGEWSFFDHECYEGGDIFHSLMSARYVGWGLSTGLVVGYKFYISNRFRLDVNIGAGYVHLQHAIYQLGGEYSGASIHQKVTREGFYPTRFGINLCYILF